METTQSPHIIKIAPDVNPHGYTGSSVYYGCKKLKLLTTTILTFVVESTVVVIQAAHRVAVVYVHLCIVHMIIPFAGKVFFFNYEL